MASLNSTIDGMGFEELGQPGSQVVDVWITGSVTANSVSGTNVYGTTGSFVNTRITTENVVDIIGTTISGTTIRVGGQGILQSVAIDNATQLFGYRIKAGSVLTGDDGVGTINFPSAGSFSTANYFIALNPRDWTVVASSGLNWMASGTRRASGCQILGPSGTVYDWIAVGL